MSQIVARLGHLAALAAARSGGRPVSAERGALTRFIDRVLAAVRRYALPLHWTGSVLTAFALYLYARLVALTARLSLASAKSWPEIPGPCVLATWHGCAPSLLVAITIRRPRPPLAIMIATDPRGDFLALLCRMLGLRVARGMGGERGWEALTKLAGEIGRGACAVITADGLGPARVAKIGAVALASAAGVPLLAAGGDCRPAIFEKHKWDRARLPVPFGRIAVALGRPMLVPFLSSSADLEAARSRAEAALNEATEAATSALFRTTS